MKKHEASKRDTKRVNIIFRKLNNGILSVVIFALIDEKACVKYCDKGVESIYDDLFNIITNDGVMIESPSIDLHPTYHFSRGN
jgi:hypothetical protein